MFEYYISIMNICSRELWRGIILVNNDVFVKLNYKNIGEFKSLIINKDLEESENNKYVMCAGNYNKDGWTFVFKARSIKEAEALINNNKFSNKALYNNQEIIHNEILDKKKHINKNSINIHILEPENIEIPTWI